MVKGTVLRSSSNGFAIEMKDGCNGANVLILLWSAVIAFPATIFYKVKGVLWGALTIQSVNLLRFISLFYLGQYSLSLFAFAHEYLWESLIMLDGLLFFGWWVHLVFHSFPRPNANPQVVGRIAAPQFVAADRHTDLLVVGITNA